MTRKDYTLIASALSDCLLEVQSADGFDLHATIAVTLSRRLQDSYANFDQTCFLKACGLDIVEPG